MLVLKVTHSIGCVHSFVAANLLCPSGTITFSVVRDVLVRWFVGSLSQMAKVMQSFPGQSGIVYCLSRKDCEKVRCGALRCAAVRCAAVDIVLSVFKLCFTKVFSIPRLRRQSSLLFPLHSLVLFQAKNSGKVSRQHETNCSKPCLCVYCMCVRPQLPLVVAPKSHEQST